MDKILVGRSKKVTLMPEYWFKKVQGITGQLTKSEGQKIPVTIKTGFIFMYPVS